MSDATNNQREKRTETIQIYVTPSERKAVETMANANVEVRSVSEYAYREFVRPTVRRADRLGLMG